MKPVPIAHARALLEESAEELYEHAPCGYVSALTDGMIVRANERLASMVGRPAQELAGQLRLQELFTKGCQIYFETHVRPLLLMQGFVEEIALDLQSPAGSVPVLLNALVRKAGDGKPLGIRCTLLNVSERRRYEREILAARDEAEEAARQKSELISMISHDLRSPLAAIATVGELLESTDLSEDQQKYLRILRSSTQNILGLINDVLDLGKLEAGRMKLEEKPFDLTQLVAGLTRELDVAAARKDLALEASIDADVPVRLVGDSIKLGRVLGNLLGNAIKFTERGAVRLMVSPVAQDAELATISFEVTDTGIGISEEQLARIFDDFTQGSEEIGKRYGGSGLGLGICRKILGLHGSKLNVDSEPCKGSRFWFTVELRVQSAGTAAPGEGAVT